MPIQKTFDITISEGKNVLFLDDDEIRLKKFKSVVPWCDLASTAQECIDKMKTKSYDLVSLDHDLGGETFVGIDVENSGSGVVRWVIENKPDVFQFIIHSMNPVGSDYMHDSLMANGYHAIKIIFPILIISIN